MTQKPMTKTQLVAALAEKTGSDKSQANDMLGALTDIVTEEVANGGAVTLPGLGKFSCRERPARTVRNPATGEQVQKEADRVAKVTIAKALKDVINA
ncbi:MAG: HU family DNA-binding protein [Pseudomonadota bacterium]